jgi:hypothetical protein
MFLTVSSVLELQSQSPAAAMLKEGISMFLGLLSAAGSASMDESALSKIKDVIIIAITRNV